MSPRNGFLGAMFFLSLAAPASAGLDHWTPFGPTGGVIDDVLIDPRSSETLWIAVRGTILKSEDGGESFQASAAGLEGQRAFLLALDPGQPDVLYAATAWPAYDGTDPGIYRTEDAGRHWTRVAGGHEDTFLSSLTVARGRPGEAGVVFAGTSRRLLRSLDAGTTFAPVIAPRVFNPFVAVAADPQTAGTVYTATRGQRWKSIDFGTTWQELHENPGGPFSPDVRDLAVAPGDPSTLYETGGGGTWRSRDGGATWTGPFPFSGDVLAVDSEDERTVYGGDSLGGFAVSHDGAETWTFVAGLPPMVLGLTNYYGTKALATAPDRPGLAAAGTAQGLFVTTDGGGRWRAPAQRGLFANPIEDLRADPFDPAHWIFRSLGTLLVSRDRGLTSTPFAAALQSFPIESITFDPFVRHQLWAVTSCPVPDDLPRLCLKKSSDDGITWKKAGGRLPNATQLFLPAPRVFLLLGAGIFRSANAGKTWERVASDTIGIPGPRATGVHFDRLAQDPRNPITLYALGTGIGYIGGSFPVIYRSADLGRTWKRWIDGEAVAFDPFHPRATHVVQRGSLLVTTTGGAPFRAVGALGLQATSKGQTLLFDRQHQGTLYVTTTLDGIRRSRDGGATWESLNAGLPTDVFHFTVTTLLQDPRFPQRFYATPASGGLYRIDLTGEEVR